MRIKNIQELRAAKKQLIENRQELESKIWNRWNELKQSLVPSNIIKNTFSEMVEKNAKEKLNSENIFKSTLTYGISLLAQKFADKIEAKLDKMRKK